VLQFESMAARSAFFALLVRNFRRTSLKSLSLLPLLTAVAAGFGALAPTTDALAQEVEHAVSVQRFQAAPGPRNYFTMRGARTDGEKAWSAGVMVNYAFEPLTVRSCQNATSCEDAKLQQDKKVVENMLTGDFLGSFTIVPRV